MGVALEDFVAATGYLPAGVHRCAWAEFGDRFVAPNEHRRGLGALLFAALEALRAAGCRRVWINGSYVTDKALPGDVDVLWDAHGVQPRRLDPVFRAEDDQTCAERRKRFGGDYIAIYDDGPDAVLIRHFQTDRAGIDKGIIVMDLSTLPTASTPTTKQHNGDDADTEGESSS